jgi:hypothetical protein
MSERVEPPSDSCPRCHGALWIADHPDDDDPDDWEWCPECREA